MKYLDITLSIILNVAAYLIFKHISRAPMGLRWYLIFMAGLGLGAVSTFLFTRSLRTFQLSVTYPVFAAGTCMLILICMTLFYKERINGLHLGGIALALGGIYLLTRP
jgi:multidrug transporter EmrE-like cation transporter